MRSSGKVISPGVTDRGGRFPAAMLLSYYDRTLEERGASSGAVPQPAVKKRDTEHAGPGAALDAGGVRDPEKLLVANLDLIRRVVRYVAGRWLLGRQDVEDLEAEVHLKLIADDYAALRRFEGRSSFPTYLITVVQRVFLDFQIGRQGKWRPSAAAKRLGPVAVELERLVCHQGRSLDEAHAILAAGFEAARVDRARLATLHAQLPVRPPRRTVDPGMLDGTPAPDGQADAGLAEIERRSSAERAQTLLAEALGLLSPEDRLLIRLAFCDGMTMAAIAVTLGVRQRPLYRTRERCLETMRRHLLSRGLDARAVADLLACPGAPVETAGLSIREVESSHSGPSHPAGTGTKETDET
jgi:RNA polymerase sigma factor (sigma-70 family)